MKVRVIDSNKYYSNYYTIGKRFPNWVRNNIPIEVGNYTVIQSKFKGVHGMIVISDRNHSYLIDRDGVEIIGGIPDEIKEMMLKEQVEQGNKRDWSVFEKDPTKGILEGGFSWDITEDGSNFWLDVLEKKNYWSFFEKYPIIYNKKYEDECKLDRYVRIIKNEDGFTDIEIGDVFKVNYIVGNDVYIHENDLLMYYSEVEFISKEEYEKCKLEVDNMFFCEYGKTLIHTSIKDDGDIYSFLNGTEIPPNSMVEVILHPFIYSCRKWDSIALVKYNGKYNVIQDEKLKNFKEVKLDYTALKQQFKEAKDALEQIKSKVKLEIENTPLTPDKVFPTKELEKRLEKIKSFNLKPIKTTFKIDFPKKVDKKIKFEL